MSEIKVYITDGERVVGFDIADSAVDTIVTGSRADRRVWQRNIGLYFEILVRNLVLAEEEAGNATNQNPEEEARWEADRQEVT